jgi:hypothetical protein
MLVLMLGTKIANTNIYHKSAPERFNPHGWNTLVNCKISMRPSSASNLKYQEEIKKEQPTIASVEAKIMVTGVP